MAFEETTYTESLILVYKSSYRCNKPNNTEAILKGTLLLTLSAILPSLKPPVCIPDISRCPNASSLQIWFFNVALYTVALGNGSQPSLVAFGANQFDESDRNECQKKQSYFNWYYLCLCLGSLIGGLVFVNVEDKIGYGLGFGLSAFVVGLGVVFLFTGTPRYRYRKLVQNPFVGIAKVMTAAILKWPVKVPEDSKFLNYANSTHSMGPSWSTPHTQRFRFLDKAATITVSDCSASGHVNPWRLCTVEQVECLKSILTLLPIWASIVLYGTMYTQMTSVFVLQGSFMDTHFGVFDIPPALLNIVDTLSVIIVTCMYEWLITPLSAQLNGRTVGFTFLQRIGVGQFVVILAMASAAFLERERLRFANPNKTAAIAVNILWQIPQYSLIGVSEVFTYIGQIEFFYDQAPQTVQTLGTALSFSAIALGSFLAGWLVTFLQNITSTNGRGGWIPRDISDGHLDYYFLTLAIISSGNLIYFLLVASVYQYRTVPDEATSEDGGGVYNN